MCLQLVPLSWYNLLLPRYARAGRRAGRVAARPRGPADVGRQRRVPAPGADLPGQHRPALPARPGGRGQPVTGLTKLLSDRLVPLDSTLLRFWVWSSGEKLNIVVSGRTKDPRGERSYWDHLFLKLKTTWTNFKLLKQKNRWTSTEMLS